MMLEHQEKLLNKGKHTNIEQNQNKIIKEL
jgi:hypothetical protein